MYPWLQKDTASSCDVYFCKNCREKATGGKSQWVTGWKGGYDGHRQESLKLHQDSRIHKEHAKAANFSSVEKQDAVCERPTPEAELLNKWRTTLPRQTFDAILNYPE